MMNSERASVIVAYPLLPIRPGGHAPDPGPGAAPTLIRVGGAGAGVDRPRGGQIRMSTPARATHQPRHNSPGDSNPAAGTPTTLKEIRIDPMGARLTIAIAIRAKGVDATTRGVEARIEAAITTMPSREKSRPSGMP